MSMSNGLLAIPGMVSGLPTQSIIQELVNARAAAETPLKNQQAAINNQISAWNGLTPAFTDFQNSLQTLVNPSTWNTMTANSSNSTAISVTANTGATAGTYTVLSDQLAQGQTMASGNPNLSPTNVGVASTFQIVQNGKTATVNVSNGDSLQTIASAINTSAQAAGVNVSASVFTNADGTAKLMVSSTQTGSQSSFTMQDTGGGTFVSNTLQMGVTMTAQDAQAEVNGVTVTSSTNTFTNAINGLNFTLNQAPPSGQPGIASTVTVSQDTSTISNAVNDFISKYNTLVQNLESASSISTSGGTNGPLAGDTTVQGILMNLETSVGNLIPNSGSLTGLGQIGIVLHSDGTLAFDSTAAADGGTAGGLNGQSIFNNFLSTDSADLQQLFGVVSVDGLSPTTGLGGLVNGVINSAIDPVNGSITNMVSSLNTQNTTLADEISQMDDANQQYQDQLEAQFNAMETQIAALQSQQQWLNSFSGTTTTSSSSSSSSSSKA